MIPSTWRCLEVDGVAPCMTIGIVLAGGLSSRMGCDKSLLCFDGQGFDGEVLESERFDERRVEVESIDGKNVERRVSEKKASEHKTSKSKILKNKGCDKLAFKRPANQLERTEQLLRQVGCDSVLISRNRPSQVYACIEDEYQQAGPLGGIHACVQYAMSTLSLAYCRFLICPIDMPLMNGEFLQQLLKASDKTQACYFSDHYLPCAVRCHTAALIKNLESRLEAQKGSVKHWLSDMDAHVLSFEDSFAFINTNTPNDWHRAQRLREASQNRAV